MGGVSSWAPMPLSFGAWVVTEWSDECENVVKHPDVIILVTTRSQTRWTVSRGRLVWNPSKEFQTLVKYMPPRIYAKLFLQLVVAECQTHVMLVFPLVPVWWHWEDSYEKVMTVYSWVNPPPCETQESPNLVLKGLLCCLKADVCWVCTHETGAQPLWYWCPAQWEFSLRSPYPYSATYDRQTWIRLWIVHLRE